MAGVIEARGIVVTDNNGLRLVLARREGMTDHNDFAWALERVQSMADVARRNAGVYGVRLLKGHGYPDDVMRDAQDALAIEIVLKGLQMDAIHDINDEIQDMATALGDAVPTKLLKLISDLDWLLNGK